MHMGGECDLLGIVQEIEIWLYYEMVYALTKICSGEWDTQNSLGFWDTNGRKTRPSDNNEKRKWKRTCRIEEFAVPADHKGKIKEREKRLVFGSCLRTKKAV